MTTAQLHATLVQQHVENDAQMRRLTSDQRMQLVQTLIRLSGPLEDPTGIHGGEATAIASWLLSGDRKVLTLKTHG